MCFWSLARDPWPAVRPGRLASALAPRRVRPVVYAATYTTAVLVLPSRPVLRRSACSTVSGRRAYCGMITVYTTDRHLYYGLARGPLYYGFRIFVQNFRHRGLWLSPKNTQSVFLECMSIVFDRILRCRWSLVVGSPSTILSSSALAISAVQVRASTVGWWLRRHGNLQR